MTQLLLALLVAATTLQPASRPVSGTPRLDDPGAVRAGVMVGSDTVRVGVPFVIQLRVRAPEGAEVIFPPGPDTSGVVQPLDPPQLMPGADSAVTDRTMRYRLAAWDVGTREVQLGRVIVRLGTQQRELRLDPIAVQVATVLPADSAQRVPRDARPLIEFPRAWWIPWLIALVAAAMVGLLLWWYLRRRRGRGQAPVAIDALSAAELRFRQIDALALPEAGEPGRHVALTQEVLREYLARTIPEASAALTSLELLQATAARTELPGARLYPLLRDGDLVKFAARPIDGSRARELGRESEAIVREVDAALVAAAAAAAAADQSGETSATEAGIGSAA